MSRSRVLAAVAAGALLGGTALVAGLPAGAQEPSQVRILHALDLPGEGVGGTPVSVCVNGDVIDDDFRVGEAIGPVALPAGDYTVGVFGPGAPNCEGEPLFGDTLPVPGGLDLTVMAYWNIEGDGSPDLGVLVDDVSCVEAGDGRVTARHGANVSDVDVLADGALLFANLPNGGQASADVPAGTYSAAIAVAGTTDPVIGPANVGGDAAADTQVYAFGAIEGPPGVFVIEAPLPVCEVPIVPTTVAPPTTVPAAPVTPASPTFTG